jgi:hypothetical protein|tara:strand:+ start:2077 stop:2463 length:387 start_codon:yes stop_codon:yes gene_type:complete
MEKVVKLDVSQMTHEEMKAMNSKEWRSLGHVIANEILSPMKPIERLEVLKNAPSSMLPYEHWIRKSKSQIMQFYMNAQSTRSCGGHHKGAMNDRAVVNYERVMEAHEIPIPERKICSIMGIFNGEGSY